MKHLLAPEEEFNSHFAGGDVAASSANGSSCDSRESIPSKLTRV